MSMPVEHDTAHRTSEPIDAPVDHPMGQPVDQQMRQSMDQRMDQQADEPVGGSTVQDDTVQAGTADGDREVIQRRWREIQATFVDDPRTAVQDADTLVHDAMDWITQLIEGRRHALSTAWSDDTTSTEDLRVSLQQYRALLDRVASFQV